MLNSKLLCSSLNGGNIVKPGDYNYILTIGQTADSSTPGNIIYGFYKKSDTNIIGSIEPEFSPLTRMYFICEQDSNPETVTWYLQRERGFGTPDRGYPLYFGRADLRILRTDYETVSFYWGYMCTYNNMPFSPQDIIVGTQIPIWLSSSDPPPWA